MIGQTLKFFQALIKDLMQLHQMDRFVMSYDAHQELQNEMLHN